MKQEWKGRWKVAKLKVVALIYKFIEWLISCRVFPQPYLITNSAREVTYVWLTEQQLKEWNLHVFIKKEKPS